MKSVIFFICFSFHGTLLGQSKPIDIDWIPATSKASNQYLWRLTIEDALGKKDSLFFGYPPQSRFNYLDSTLGEKLINVDTSTLIYFIEKSKGWYSKKVYGNFEDTVDDFRTLFYYSTIKLLKLNWLDHLTIHNNLMYISSFNTSIFSKYFPLKIK